MIKIYHEKWDQITAYFTFSVENNQMRTSKYQSHKHYLSTVKEYYFPNFCLCVLEQMFLSSSID